MNSRIFTQAPLTAILLLFFPFYYNGALLAEDTFHTFTDKTKLGIRRKDGREFEMSILTLNLEDQQFIKNWLTKNSATMAYKLDITFEESFERTKYVPGPKGRYDLKFITEKTKFDIKVKNMTRATLTGATLEYYIITEHSIFSQAYEDPDEKEPTEWFYPFDYWSRKEGNIPKVPVEKLISLNYKKIPVTDLLYSYSADISTDTVPIREITKSITRDSLNKDTLLGMIIRVTDKEGNELALQRSSDHEFLKKNWDEYSKMPPVDSSGRKK